jgi:chloride channel 7
VLQTLRSTSHNGFPVFSQTGIAEGYPARRSLSSQPSTTDAHASAAAGAHVPETIAEDPDSGVTFGDMASSPLPRDSGSGAAAAAAPSGSGGGGGGGGGATPLEGLILRSQLLVLLQRRHFCDALGRPVGREADEKVEFDLEVGCGWFGGFNMISRV